MRLPLGAALTLAGLVGERFARREHAPRPVRRVRPGDDARLDTILSAVPCRVQAIYLEGGVGLMAQVQITGGGCSPYPRGALVDRPASCVLPLVTGRGVYATREQFDIEYVPGGARIT